MWFEVWSESKQKPYYVNSTTKETTWAVPIIYTSSETGYDDIAQDESREYQRHTEQVRKKNNEAKRHLIHNYLPSRGMIRVLDVACGKGGDLWKWRDTGKVSQYVGIDSSPFSIEEARERATKVENLSTRFEVLDARRDMDWAEAFGGHFDIISVQMALHYFFGSEKTAKNFFQRAARACAPGGKMLATFPSCDIVVSILEGHRRPPTHMHFQTDVPKITSRQPIPYRYTFEGSVPGIPEFTVPVYLLEKICEETGFIPRHVRTFGELYHAYVFIKK